MTNFKAADIKKKLEGYKMISLSKTSELKAGDRIRYIKNNEFRGGGAVKMNKYPDYIVLLNVVNKASWCMQLKDPELTKIWVKPLEKLQMERNETQKIMQLYKEGKLVKKK
mgnify:CR=1 FL=1